MSAKRTFLAALALSLCLLGLLLAFFVINYNIRYTMYGQVDFDTTYVMEGGLPRLTDRTGVPLFALPEELPVPVDAPTRLLLELYGWLADTLL